MRERERERGREGGREREGEGERQREREREREAKVMLGRSSLLGNWPNFTDDKRSLGPSPIPPSLGPSPVPTLQAPHQTVPAVRYQSIEDYLKAEMEEDYSVCRHVEFSATMCQGYLVKEGGKQVLLAISLACAFFFTPVQSV